MDPGMPGKIFCLSFVNRSLFRVWLLTLSHFEQTKQKQKCGSNRLEKMFQDPIFVGNLSKSLCFKLFLSCCALSFTFLLPVQHPSKRKNIYRVGESDSNLDLTISKTLVHVTFDLFFLNNETKIRSHLSCVLLRWCSFCD